MTDAPVGHWQAPDLDQFHWASWGEGESFLYNPASGQTHLLNDLGRALLDSLADDAQTAQSLADGLYHPECGLSPGSFTDIVQQHLAQLALLQLVQPAP